MKYELQNLLRKEGEHVRGPMSPVLFAQAMAKHMEEPNYNLVVRVRFEDEHVFQELEHGEGWTGYDTLLLGLVGNKNAYVGLWIDTGLGGVPVAMRDLVDEAATFTPIYGEHRKKPDWVFPEDATVDAILKDALERRNEFAMH